MNRENLGDHGLSDEEWNERMDKDGASEKIESSEEEKPISVEKITSDIRDILVLARGGRKISMIADKLILSNTAINNFESGKTMLPSKCWHRIESAYNLDFESTERVKKLLGNLVKLREEQKLAKKKEAADEKQKEKNTRQIRDAEKKKEAEERIEKIKRGELPPDPLFREVGQRRDPSKGERKYEGYKPE